MEGGNLTPSEYTHTHTTIGEETMHTPFPLDQYLDRSISPQCRLHVSRSLLTGDRAGCIRMQCTHYSAGCSEPLMPNAGMD